MLLGIVVLMILLWAGISNRTGSDETGVSSTLGVTPISFDSARTMLADIWSKNQSGAGCGSTTQNGKWRYQFPQDFRAHPESVSEAWVLRGLLLAANKQQYAISLSMIRTAIRGCDEPLPNSEWAYREVMVASVHLHDIKHAVLHSRERVERVAQQLAGAVNDTVWANDLRLDLKEADDCSIALNAVSTGSAPKFNLEVSSSVCPTGDSDMSVDGLAAFLMSELQFAGTIDDGGKQLEVTGHGWLERSWGSLSLERGALIWDRVMLSEKVGDDHRLYSLLRSRRRSGNGKPIVSGMIVHPDGSTESLGNDQIRFRTEDERRFFRRRTALWALEIERTDGSKLYGSLRPLPEAGSSNLSDGWAGLVSFESDYGNKDQINLGYVEIGQ